MTSQLLQLNVEKQQQQKASVVPVSRLQGLRDRDTVTRFDQEVSASLSAAVHYSSYPALFIAK